MEKVIIVYTEIFFVSQLSEYQQLESIFNFVLKLFVISIVIQLRQISINKTKLNPQMNPANIDIEILVIYHF